MYSRRTDGGMKMWSDPIIDEVRQARELIEKECEYNSDKLLERAKKIEQNYPERIVSRNPVRSLQVKRMKFELAMSKVAACEPEEYDRL